MLDNKQVVVSFKYKGMDSLGQHGPVIVIDVAAFNGKLSRIRDILCASVPFRSSRPTEEYDMGWLPRSEAVKVATHYGVKLENA